MFAGQRRAEVGGLFHVMGGELQVALEVAGHLVKLLVLFGVTGLPQQGGGDPLILEGVQRPDAAGGDDRGGREDERQLDVELTHQWVFHRLRPRGRASAAGKWENSGRDARRRGSAGWVGVRRRKAAACIDVGQSRVRDGASRDGKGGGLRPGYGFVRPDGGRP